MAEEAAAAEASAASAAKPADTAASAAGSAASTSCPNRRPYHTVLTATGSVYQKWQSRIMYHRIPPCGSSPGW